MEPAATLPTPPTLEEASAHLCPQRLRIYLAGKGWQFQGIDRAYLVWTRVRSRLLTAADPDDPLYGRIQMHAVACLAEMEDRQEVAVMLDIEMGLVLPQKREKPPGQGEIIT